jgi:hypothetical protein
MFRWIYLPEPPTSLDHHYQPVAGLASCVTPSLKHQLGSTGILNLLPITYAFRPRLRGRLTLGGRTFPRKPWNFGGKDSHLAFRYSCPHNHFHTVHCLRLGRNQEPFRARFSPYGTLLYHACHPKVSRIRSFGSRFKSRSFSAQNHSTSQLLRTV